jgi:Caspase domain
MIINKKYSTIVVIGSLSLFLLIYIITDVAKCEPASFLRQNETGENKQNPPQKTPENTDKDKNLPKVKTSKHALLVGVTDYNNEKIKALVGPINDVELMQSTLIKFGFEDQNIKKLTDKESKLNGKDLEPTRANIQREFKNIQDKCKEGDDVFILLSGHGSQQPAAKIQSSGVPEPDNKDETFLPKDTGSWEGKDDSVANVITDDDIFLWVSGIRNKGAFVFMVFDCCHAGTMLRGDNGETTRSIDPNAFKIPNERFNVDRQETKVSNPGLVGAGKYSGGVFAIYACKENEEAPEFPLPQGVAKNQVHGLLTYSLCSLLLESLSNKGIVTYRELSGFMPAKYIGLKRSAPTPSAEYGSEDGNREVFGKEIWKNRKPFTIKIDGDDYKVNAGRLAGLSENVILEVSAPLGGNDDVIGFVRVGDLSNLEGIVFPITHKDEKKEWKALANIPDQARCKQITFDFGENRIKIGVSKSMGISNPSSDFKPLSANQFDGLSNFLNDNDKDKPWKFTQNTAEADWLVTVWEDSSISLIPKGGMVASTNPINKDRGFKLESKLNSLTNLDEVAQSICKVQSLLSLAVVANDFSESDINYPYFDAKLIIQNDKEKEELKVKQITKLFGGEKDPTNKYQGGDKITLEVTNKRASELDFYVFYIDSAYNLSMVFPNLKSSPGDNRIIGNGKISNPTLTGINAQTLGKEHFILIGLKASGEQAANLSGLVSKGPEKMKNALAKTRGSGIDKSLELLFKYAFSQGDPVRGSSSQSTLGECMIRWYPVEVVLGKRPVNLQKEQLK